MSRAEGATVDNGGASLPTLSGNGAALIALAIIKSNADRPGATYLDYFVPFVADALRAAPSDIATTEQVRTHLASEFGLHVPLPVVRTLLKRAVSHGYARPYDGAFRRDDEKLAAIDFQSARQTVVRQQNQLASALIAYAAKNYRLQWTAETAEKNLLSVIRDRSVEVVRASLKGDRFDPASGPQEEYVVQRFILDCYTSDATLFQFIENISKGNMLADALYYPVEDVRRKPKRLDVYLDTTLVIRALGLNVPAVVDSAREVLALAKAQNCELRVFDHTVTEVSEVLDAVGRALRRVHSTRVPHGETLNYCLDNRLGASDVELIVQRLTERLLELDIHIYSAPKHEVALSVDEKKLQQHLSDSIPYRREEALFRDIDSLTAVFRLRRGQLFPRIEDAGHVFVTTNAPLARISAQFFRDEYAKYAAPPCLLDHIFATLMWLKEPLQAPSLPRKLVIADCYAAMNPGDALWRTYLSHVERLRSQNSLTEEDYFLLRYGHESRELLLEFTRSDVNAVTEGTPLEVLRAAKERMRDEAEEQLIKSRAEGEALLADERKKREDAEARARNAEAQLRDNKVGDRLAVRRRARWQAYAILTPAVVLAMAILATATTLGIPGLFPNSAPAKFIGAGVVSLAAVASLASQLFGGSVKDWFDGAFVKVALRTERRLLRGRPDLNFEVTADIQPPPARVWTALVPAASLVAAMVMTLYLTQSDAATAPLQQPAPEDSTETHSAIAAPPTVPTPTPAATTDGKSAQ